MRKEVTCYQFELGEKVQIPGAKHRSELKLVKDNLLQIMLASSSPGLGTSG